MYDPVFLHGLNEFSISSLILGSPATCLTTWMSATHLSHERELWKLFTPSFWGIHQQPLAGLIASIACYYRWGNHSIAKCLGSQSFNWRPEQCDSTLNATWKFSPRGARAQSEVQITITAGHLGKDPEKTELVLNDELDFNEERKMMGKKMRTNEVEGRAW